ncbi:MAG: hypothetical protein ACYDAR_18120 [Thermomicrobiales bacterium]
MKRRIASTISGMIIVLFLIACGGNGGANDASKTATARTADANDAATVTAFAGGGRVTSTGQASSTNPATRSAGGKGSFIFATLPAGAPAAGASRGTVTSAGTARTGTPAGLVGNLYTDPQGRFTLTMPQGWSIQQAASASIDFEAAPAALRGAFQIAAQDVGTGITLDDYATGTMNSIMQNLTSFQPVQGGIQQTTIAGMPARRFDFTGQDGTTNLRAAVFVVKNGTTAYGFLIAADPADFDAVFAQAQQFIDTFTFLP